MYRRVGRVGVRVGVGVGVVECQLNELDVPTAPATYTRINVL